METDRPQTEHGPNSRRFTVAEAAEILGITAEAVRTRIKRGKLESFKEPPDRTGTVYVLLQVDQTGPNIDPTSQVQDKASDQTEQRAELVYALREQVETLREQAAYLQGVIATRDRELEQRAEEIRRRDMALEREQQLTAMFATRLGELEAPREEREEAMPDARESPEGPGPTEKTFAPASGGRHGGTEAPEAGGERRPWWRRVFGS